MGNQTKRKESVPLPEDKAYYMTPDVTAYLGVSSVTVSRWLREYRILDSRIRRKERKRFWTKENIFHLEKMDKYRREEGYTFKGAIRRVEMEKREKNRLDRERQKAR